MRWKLDPHLARMLVGLEEWARTKLAEQNIRWPGLWIISGHRTAVTQAVLNPEVEDSLHVRCPSLAVDLSIGQVVGIGGPEMVWAWLGARWKLMGGRWGGDFKWERSPLPNPDELNHFDLGVGVD